jgi:hypothetical protein
MATAKTLRITLDLKVVPLSEEALEESNRDLPEEAHMTAEDALEEADAFELAEAVQGMFGDEDAVKEAFAGSGIFVTFEGQPLIVEAEFQD